MSKKLWSLSSLAVELNRNFRTLRRALDGTKCDGKIAGRPAFYMATAIAALDAHTMRTGYVRSKPAPERYDAALEEKIGAIEESGREVDALLAKLRGEKSVQRRRAMIEGGAGRCVGAHSRALQATVHDDANGPLRQCFVDAMMDHVMGEVAALCEWKIEQPESQ